MAYLTGTLENRYDVLRESDTGLGRRRLPRGHTWAGAEGNHDRNAGAEPGLNSHTDFSSCMGTRTLSEFR